MTTKANEQQILKVKLQPLVNVRLTRDKAAKEAAEAKAAEEAEIKRKADESQKQKAYAAKIAAEKAILFSKVTRGTMIDPRDGQSYHTILYENKAGYSKTWFAENLNYKIDRPSNNHEHKPYYKARVYEDDEYNRTTYGLLYTRNEALYSCPKGWHLPHEDEWRDLIGVFGGFDKAGREFSLTLGGNIGHPKGIDVGGFASEAGGIQLSYGENKFDEKGKRTYYWSVSKYANWKVAAVLLKYGKYKTETSLIKLSGENRLSCRCVKND